MSMMNMRQKIRDTTGSDKVTFKKDGTTEFRRSYFYRHGCSAEKFRDSVVAQLAAVNLHLEVIECRDRWAPWPRDSYFLVRGHIRIGEVEV